MEDKPLLTIKCLVYNHEPYLRQCLDGFVMQKTDFKFEAIVHDDCSTDGSANIIREYAEKHPDIIKPVFEKENQYTKVGFKGIINIMQPYVHGKYIAFCEGDDYWTDCNKLQMQVDFLESHSEYGLIYTNARQFDDDNGNTYKAWARQSCFKDILLNQSPIVTLTVCYRKELVDSYYQEVDSEADWKMADYPLWLYISYYTKIKFIDKVTGVYRVLKESASHSLNVDKNVAFVFSVYSIKEYFDKNYCNNKYYREIEQHTLNDLFDVSYHCNKNMSVQLFEFAKSKSLLSLRVLVKLFLYSFKIGRFFIKLSNNGLR